MEQDGAKGADKLTVFEAWKDDDGWSDKEKYAVYEMYAGSLMAAGAEATGETGSAFMAPDEALSGIFDVYYPSIDGAYAEEYAFTLYEAYRESEARQFIRNLGTYEMNSIRGIMELLVSYTLNDGGEEGAKELEASFETLQDDETLSRNEKYALYTMYADILYFKETAYMDD